MYLFTIEMVEKFLGGSVHGFWRIEPLIDGRNALQQKQNYYYIWCLAPE